MGCLAKRGVGGPITAREVARRPSGLRFKLEAATPSESMACVTTQLLTSLETKPASREPFCGHTACRWNDSTANE